MVSNIFYFHPCLGKWSNLTNIFQMSWIHQLEKFLPLGMIQIPQVQGTWAWGWMVKLWSFPWPLNLMLPSTLPIISHYDVSINYKNAAIHTQFFKCAFCFFSWMQVLELPIGSGSVSVMLADQLCVWVITFSRFFGHQFLGHNCFFRQHVLNLGR